MKKTVTKLALLIIGMAAFSCTVENAPSLIPKNNFGEKPTALSNANIESESAFQPVFDALPTGSLGKPIVNSQGQTLETLSLADADMCARQYGCIVITATNTARGFVSRSNVVFPFNAVFTEYSLDRCPYGATAAGTCFDPYFSLVGDSKNFAVGDVVYIPSFKDVVMADGTKHNGYLIVREVRSFSNTDAVSIRLMSGFQTFADTAPEFQLLNMEGISKVVDSAFATAIRTERGYPSLPTSVLEKGREQLRDLSN